MDLTIAANDTKLDPCQLALITSLSWRGGERD
jgi:hypothetical protein